MGTKINNKKKRIMAIVTKPQYFIGTVVGISKDDDPTKKLKKTREFHEIIVDIPGVIQGVRAFPEMTELDEPKVGDQVLLLSLDPLYNSYFVYRKLKENDFIGFRASGKMVDITPEYITVGVFKEDLKDYGNDEHWNDGKISSNHITSLTIDNKGTITVEAAKDNGSEGNLIVYLKGKTDITIDGSDGNNIEIKNNSKIDISGNSEVNIKGDNKVNISGKSDISVTGACTIDCKNKVEINAMTQCDINAKASCTITSPSITLKGPGTLTCNGTTLINPTGPFCGLPNCLFTGAPHASNTVMTT